METIQPLPIAADSTPVPIQSASTEREQAGTLYGKMALCESRGNSGVRDEKNAAGRTPTVQAIVAGADRPDNSDAESPSNGDLASYGDQPGFVESAETYLVSAAIEARSLIGEHGNNDRLPPAVREANINKAWHLLDRALQKSPPAPQRKHNASSSLPDASAVTSGAHFRALSTREYLAGLRNPQSRYRHDADRLLSYGGEYAVRGAKLHEALDRINAVFGA